MNITYSILDLNIFEYYRMYIIQFVTIVESFLYHYK